MSENISTSSFPRMELFRESEDFTPKPWGGELIWAKTDKYVAKILFIKKDCMLSLQHHEKKQETMFVSSGKVKFTIGDSLDNLRDCILQKDSSIHICPKSIHRVCAIENSEIFEVSTIEITDIVRHSDIYGRK